MKCCNFDTIFPGNDHFGVEDLEDQSYSDVDDFPVGGLNASAILISLNEWDFLLCAQNLKLVMLRFSTTR